MFSSWPQQAQRPCLIRLYRGGFLELLITKKLKHLYPYYYRIQALRDQLGDQITLVGAEARREVYRYRDTPLEVELQGCTCSKGCNSGPPVWNSSGIAP